MGKRIKKVGVVMGVYSLSFLFSFCVFIALFHTLFLRRLDVLMYRGAIFAILASFMGVFLLTVIRHFFLKLWIGRKDIVIVFLLCCCLNMIFFVLVPVTVERSISVFMLSYMEEHPDLSYGKEDMEKIFIEKYIYEYGAFEKRFNEQLVTGNIIENVDGTYHITERGELFVLGFRFIADLFHTDKRLVYPDEN